MTRSLFLSLALALLIPSSLLAQERDSDTRSPRAQSSDERAAPDAPDARSPRVQSRGERDSPDDPDTRSPRAQSRGERDLDDDPESFLEGYRTPLEVLNERMIGAASRAVRFDWRKTLFGVAIQGSDLLERNNFGSTRLGGHVRTPLGSNFIGELGVNWVFNWETDSTRKLALTPYRQAGRPSRLELDFNFAFPLAEGVATAWPSFFPATELVFSAIAGVRYSYYPGAFKNAKWSQVGRAILAPQLTTIELENLERTRPGGMQIDPARYGMLAGISLDVYFASGGYLSPRAMVAVPLFNVVSDSRLGLWWEFTLAAGWAF